MSLSFDLIKSAVRSGVLLSGSNAQVIFYFPNAPRPSLPYSAIEFTSWNPIVNDWEMINPETGLVSQYGFRELNVRLHFFGPNAYAEVAKVISGLERDSVRDAMRAICPISILSSSSADLTSELVENSFEPRATVDLVYLVNLEDGTTQTDYGYFTTVSDIEWTDKP